MQHAIKICKRFYFEKKVKNLKETSVGKWWNEIKNLSGFSKKVGQWYTQFIDSDRVKSVGQLCDSIHDYFISLTLGFAPLCPSNVANIAVNPFEIPAELYVSEREAYIALHKTKIRKTPGPDNIPNIILK